MQADSSDGMPRLSPAEFASLVRALWDMAELGGQAAGLTPDAAYRLSRDFAEENTELGKLLENGAERPMEHTAFRLAFTAVGVALYSGPDSTFEPRAVKLPTWALLSCLGSALQSTMNPMSPMGWVVTACVLGAGVKASSQPYRGVHAQLLWEMYASTDSGGHLSLPRAHLLANVNSSRERVNQPNLDEKEFAAAVRHLADAQLLRTGEGDTLKWGVVTLG